MRFKTFFLINLVFLFLIFSFNSINALTWQTDYSTISVNTSDFWDNLDTPADINIPNYETDPIFSANFTNMQIDCVAGNYTYGVYGNGTLKCRSDASGAAAETDPYWTANYTTIFKGLINNASYLRTDNATYDTYASNVSRNWTLNAYNNWNTAWLSTYNLTYLGSVNNASYLSTYNLTYHNYATNVSRNYTLDAYNNWNTAWLSTYNATYLGSVNNASYLSTYNSSYHTHTSSTGADHSYIDQDVTNGASPEYFSILFELGSGNELTLRGSGDGSSTLTFDTNDVSRTITLSGSPTLSNWFNQDVRTTATPTFVGTLFDWTQDYLITNRGGLVMAFQGRTSGQYSSYDFYTKDGDGTDPLYFQWFAKGTPASLTDAEWLGFFYSSSDREFWLRSRALNDGTLMPIVIYTVGNTDQLKIDVEGEIYMAQAVDDALSNLRDAKWDSATGQLGYDSSSIRYKENVKNMTDEMSEKIYQLRPITFDKIDGAKNQIGLTAEEVNELFPQCVFYKREEVWGICEDEQFGDYECVKSYKLEINKTTGKPIPEGINSECLISPLIQITQNLNQENQMLKDELCIFDNHFSWCVK